MRKGASIKIKNKNLYLKTKIANFFVYFFSDLTIKSNVLSASGSNKMSPRPMERELRTPDNRQLVQNNSLYSSLSQPRTPDTSLPMSLTVSSATSTPPSSMHSRKTPNIGRGYNQPSVYEMAALTTDLDTQIITSKIKEALLAHNIGQKVRLFFNTNI